MSSDLTIILALFAFVLSMFGAAWLSNRATARNFDLLDKRMDERDKRMDERDKRMDASIASLEKRMDARFSAVESRLDRIERQLEAIIKTLLPSR